MITIRINKTIKVECFSNGIRIYLNINNKWYCLKLNNNEIELLKYILKVVDL